MPNSVQLYEKFKRSRAIVLLCDNLTPDALALVFKELTFAEDETGECEAIATIFLEQLTALVGEEAAATMAAT